MADPATAPSAQDLRDEVRAWLEENWAPDRDLLEWREILVNSGWGKPSWPVESFGRGLPAHADALVWEEFDRFGAAGLASAGVGVMLAAPTLLRHGLPGQHHDILRRTLTGEFRWCQLFSEPGCGSDLAAVTTRADWNGAQWVVRGQKMWTSAARQATHGSLLARTNWDVPKHQGLTFFAFPMMQDGVDIRPMVMMNGRKSFSEVFLNDAVTGPESVIGDVGGGWPVAMTTLAEERSVRRMGPRPGRTFSGRTHAQAEAEAEEFRSLYDWYPQREGLPDWIVDHYRTSGRPDPVLRDKVAEVYSLHRAVSWTKQRLKESKAPAASASVTKLMTTRLARQASATHAEIEVAGALLAGPQSPTHGLVADIITSVPATSLSAGTDQIQQNIIGERLLGLPAEPRIDKDVPFRDVPRN